MVFEVLLVSLNLMCMALNRQQKLILKIHSINTTTASNENIFYKQQLEIRRKL